MAIEIHGLAPLLQVFDMPRAVHFYRDLLGFELVHHSPLVRDHTGEYFHWAMLRLNDVTIMLNTAYDTGERPAEADPARVAAHNDTGLFIGCPDVEGTCEKLREAGVRIQEEPSITGYGMKRFSVVDPDGYG